MVWCGVFAWAALLVWSIAFAEVVPDPKDNPDSALLPWSARTW